MEKNKNYAGQELTDMEQDGNYAVHELTDEELDAITGGTSLPGAPMRKSEETRPTSRIGRVGYYVELFLETLR
jgi:bacteriocin-like protein